MIKVAKEVYMRKILIVLSLCLMLCGCGNKSRSNNIEKLMKENEYIIIDVRTESEYNESHLVDAINIPYYKLDDSLDKDKIIFVYCKSGVRSKMAYDTLTKLEYTVYDLGAFSQIDLPKE